MLRPMGIALITISGCMCAPSSAWPSRHAVMKHSAAPSALCATMPIRFILWTSSWHELEAELFDNPIGRRIVRIRFDDDELQFETLEVLRDRLPEELGAGSRHAAVRTPHVQMRRSVVAPVDLVDAGMT